MFWGRKGGAGYQHLEAFTRGHPQLFHGSSAVPFKKGDEAEMQLAVDTFFEELAELKETDA